MDEILYDHRKRLVDFRIFAKETKAEILIDGKPVGTHCTGYTLSQKAGERPKLTLEFDVPDAAADGAAEVEEDQV